MASEISADRLIPFRWPAGWTDPKLITLLQGGPVNCVLFDGAPPQPLADAVRKAGLVVREWSTLAAAPLGDIKWNSIAPILAITEVAWPRIKPQARGGGAQAVSGPTGSPWIDSTSWVARLAVSRAPGKQIWLGFTPPQDAPPSESAYQIAIADCAATTARWMISLHPSISDGLAAGNADALKTWRSMMDTLSFFEKRRAWRSYAHDGPLGIVSTFSGTNEFLGTEVLNLAARRNLLYRVIDRSALASADLTGLRAVLWLDPERPASALIDKLSAFARAGGLLIAQRNVALAFKAGNVVDCPVTGYELKAFGKGTLASPSRNWEDPYWVAVEVHNLVSRRHDPIRMFNASSLWVHNSVVPRGQGSLIQLVNFTGRPGGSVSLRIEKPHRSVAIHTLESGGPQPLKPVQVEKTQEYYLPSFSVYAALEVTA
jgi:hypothetical protein